MSPGKKNLYKSQISLARWRNENLSSADQKKVIACALQLLCNSPSVGCFCTPVTLSETFLSFFFFLCLSIHGYPGLSQRQHNDLLCASFFWIHQRVCHLVWHLWLLLMSQAWNTPSAVLFSYCWKPLEVHLQSAAAQAWHTMVGVYIWIWEYCPLKLVGRS